MKKTALLILLTFVYSISNAQVPFPEKPSNYVTDEANVLGKNDLNKLNLKLKQFEDSTSNQLFVYIANSLNGNSLENYTQQIFDAWQIGKKGKDNGVLISVFVTDREFRIHTGYGLEGVLPDVLTKKIQEEYMVPEFKEGNYFQGINNGIDVIHGITSGAFKADNIAKNKPYKTKLFTNVFLFVLFGAISLRVIFYMILPTKGKSKKEKSFKNRNIVLYSYIALIAGLYFAILSFQNTSTNYSIFFGGLKYISISTFIFVPSYAELIDRKNRFVLGLSVFLYFTACTCIYTYVVGWHIDGLLGFKLVNYTDLAYKIICGLSVIPFIYVSPWPEEIISFFKNFKNRKSTSSNNEYDGVKEKRTYNDDDSSSSSSSDSSSDSDFSGGGGGRSGGGGSSSSW